MAISSDGFIAGPDDETPWSDEAWESFQKFVLSCDAVLLGRRTFEIMSDADELVVGPEYYVVSNNEALETGTMHRISIKSKDDLPKAEKIGVIGGGELNGQLARLGLIDELILDIEPIMLGNGIRLFGKHTIPLKLELLGSRLIGDNTIQRHYAIRR